MGLVIGGEVDRVPPTILERVGVRAVRNLGRDDTIETQETDVPVRADTLVAGLRVSTFIDDRQAVGRLYTFGHAAEDVANGEFLDLLFFTPDDVATTIWFDPSGVGDMSFQAFENADPAASQGTALDILNLNRFFRLDRPARASAFHTPDFTGGDTGEQLLDRVLIGGEKKDAGIVSGRNIGQAILLPGVNYLFRLVNGSGENQDMALYCTFVEALASSASPAQQRGIRNAREGYGL